MVKSSSQEYVAPTPVETHKKEGGKADVINKRRVSIIKASELSTHTGKNPIPVLGGLG